MQLTSLNEPQKYSPFTGFIPFLWLSLACIGGILLAELAGWPVWVWIGVFLICLATWGSAAWLPKSLVLTHRLRRWTRLDQRLPGIFLAAVFFLGGWRFSAAQPIISSTHTAFYNNRASVQIVGKVIKPPDPRDNHTNLVLQVESLLPLEELPDQFFPGEVSGKVLIQVTSKRDWSYGDRLQVTGKLITPSETADFSYRDFLANQGIYSLMSYARVDWVEPDQGDPIRSSIFNLRQKSSEVLQVLFPSPEAELLSGILLGRDQGISKELQSAFRKTGMTHIIAISGFNITILAGLFSGIFTRLLGRKLGAVTAIIGIAGYTILVGADAAVVRAAIIGTLGVLGGMFGRRQNGLNSLGLATFGMMMVNPNILWDIGFQLSVAATLGLVLYAQPMEAWFIRTASRWVSEQQANLLVGPISECILFTLAAQVMTLPILAYHFGEVSWIALIANPLVLPAQSLVMILGGMALLAGLLLPALGQFFSILALPFVRYTVKMVTLIARLPGADLTLPDFHILWLGIFYSALFFITLSKPERRKQLRRSAVSPGLILLLMSAIVVFVWNDILTVPDGNLHLTLLDSQGSLLIQTPEGKTLLVNGGSSPSSLNHALGQMLPENKLDGLIVASTAREDINALTGVLTKITPEMVLWGVAPQANQTTAAVYTLLTTKDVPITTLQAGQSLNLGPGINLDILWVGERGALLWVTWDNFNALLPAGKITTSTPHLPQNLNVLLLQDDAQVETLSLQEINRWSPEVILLPLEKSALPLQGQHDILTLLADYPVVTTLAHPWVRVTTDGEHLWVNGGK